MRRPPIESSLRYIGLGDATGYGIAASALVRALHKIGVKIAWEPMLPGGALGLGYAPAISADAGPEDLRALRDDRRLCDNVIIHFVPEYYPHFIARERPRGARRIIGHTVWETDHLPSHWPALINQLDAVIVPTEWNRTSFRESGVVAPIFVVPHLPEFCARPAAAAELESLLRRLPDISGRRIYYTIAAWLERKGIAPLVEAFARAFDRADPVALIIKTTDYDLERIRRDPGPEGERVLVLPQFEAMVGRAVLSNGRLPPPIFLLTDELTDGELRALHNIGDYFVSLCRAEGWGLGAFEAAWLGKPVIITGWGGPAEYLSEETAFFVDWSLASVSPAESNASYTPDQNWAEPNIASAVSVLRAVMASPDEAVRRGAKAAAHLRRTIEPDMVARQLWQEINTLLPLPQTQSGPPKPVSGRGTKALEINLALVELADADPAAQKMSWKDRVLQRPSFRSRRRAKELRDSFLRNRQAGLRLHRLCVIAAHSKRDVAESILSALQETRLSCRHRHSVFGTLGAELYIVVDPSDFRVTPPAKHSIYFLSRTDEQSIDDKLIAVLARGAGVLAPSCKIIDSLQRHGLPRHLIYFVSDQHSDDGSMPSSLWGMRNLLLRALHGLGIFNDDEYEAAAPRPALTSDSIVLCQPEHFDRFENARRNKLQGTIFFPGLRHVDGWKGCAASYRFLARRALEQDLAPLTIYEDDAEFDADIGARLAAIRAYLHSRGGSWDLFSGLITNLSEQAEISKVESWKGEQLVTLNMMVGLVFSIFNRRALEYLARFCLEGDDTMVHTIDRYLERQRDLVCITPELPLVTHSSDLNSTLWVHETDADPFSPMPNSSMSQMIAESQDRLRTKIRGAVLSLDRS